MSFLISFFLLLFACSCFLRRPQKVDKISQFCFDVIVTGSIMTSKQNWEILSKFCGLLRKYELYLEPPQPIIQP